ncbi:MAG: tetratricopeptide repeat protein [Myxococcota bacterium]
MSTFLSSLLGMTAVSSLAVASSMAIAAPRTPTEAEIRDDKAIIAYHEQGDAAYAKLRAAVETGSTNPRVHLYLALIERERGRLDEAIEILGAALEQPGRMERTLRIEMAVTLSWKGEVALAKEHYAQVLRDNPGDRVASIGHARMLSWQGHHAQARRELVPLVECQPDDPQARLVLAEVDAADLRRGEARRGYRSVLVLDPDNEDAKRGLKSLKSAPRARLNALGGYAYLPSIAHAGTAELEAVIDLRAAWSMTAGYASTLLRWSDPVVTNGEARMHIAHAGVVRNLLDRRLFLGLDYRVLATEMRHHHGLTAEVSFLPIKPLTLSGSIRPGLWSDRLTDVLGRLSIDGTIHKRFTLGAQWFGYRDPGNDQRSHAVVGRLRAQILSRWSALAWGGWFFLNQDNGAAVGAETTVTVLPRLDLIARYELLTGNFVRHSVQAGVGAKF